MLTQLSMLFQALDVLHSRRRVLGSMVPDSGASEIFGIWPTTGMHLGVEEGCHEWVALGISTSCLREALGVVVAHGEWVSILIR